jgi:hypothetical protein
MRILLIASALALSAGAAMAQSQTPTDRGPQVLTGRDTTHVTLYGQTGLQEARYVVTMSTSNLASELRPESLRVTGGKWQICDEHGFRGECRIAEGRYLTLSDLGLRRIGSLRPVVGED